MLLQNKSAPFWHVFALMVAISGAEAEARNIAGTLTCTTSETSPTVLADAKLSCRFQSATGLGGNFSGSISRIGEADLPAGKRVLIWSVLAASTSTQLDDLEGQYYGETGGTPPGRLVSRKVDGIILDPVNRTVQAGEGAVPTVLELELKAVRV